MVQPAPILVPSPIKTPPIWGIKCVFDLLGINPKPDLPITVFDDIFTFLSIIVYSITDPTPKKHPLPILQ